jgi:hypothetical protein
VLTISGEVCVTVMTQRPVDPTRALMPMSGWAAASGVR